MAIDSSFDFSIILSLDKARLVNRVRLNFLGSQEMILEYNGVTNTSKEDAIEWLEANRLSVTDPKFGFRTYEGTWYCIDISYVDRNGRSPVLRQRFKIDSALENEVTEKSAGTEVLRSYYFRVVDPEAYNIPTTVDAGDQWEKRVQDNGDGTYDVAIAKVTDNNLTSTSKVLSDGFTEITVVNTNDAEQAFVSDGGSIPDPVDGETKTIQNQPLENGKFRTVVTTRSDNNLTATSNTQAEGFTEEVEVNTNSAEQFFVSGGGSVPDASQGEIKTIQNQPLDNGKFRTVVTTRENQYLSSSSGSQAGGSTNGAWSEQTAIEKNASSEASLPSVSDGELASVSNRPNDDGTFDTVTTIRSYNSVRFPIETGTTGQVYSYYSDYLPRANILIIGKNRTSAEFDTDVAYLGYSNAYDQTGALIPVYQMISNVSVRVNEVGLLDYTITARMPG